MVEIFTDGASRGNPGPGGYGTILKYGQHEKELSGGYRKTTNNRMELLSVIVGLEALHKLNQEVIVYSDSKYVVDAVEKKWLLKWIKTGFKDKKNKDLWLRFCEVYNRHQVKFTWIKGHNGHPMNERCDVLAVRASQQLDLKVDVVYEAELVYAK